MIEKPTWLTQRTVQRAGWGLGIGLVMGVLLAFAYWNQIDTFLGVIPLQDWELDTIDARFQLFPHTERASDEIFVLTIDERSLTRAAQDDFQQAWPWDRDIWSEVIDVLSLAGARTIAFDATFPEARTRLGHADAQTPANRVFVESAARHGSVVVGMASQKISEATTPEQLEIELSAIYSQGARRDLSERLCRIPPSAERIPRRPPPDEPQMRYVVRPPWPDLRRAVTAAGLTDRTDDTDGVERRTRPLTWVDGFVCPDFATAVWSADRARSGEPAQPVVERDALLFGPHRIPMDPRSGLSWIRWHGLGEDTYPVHSMAEILEIASNRNEKLNELLWEDPDATVDPESTETFDLDWIQDKIVIIGDTYQGHGDYITTPFGPEPGLYRHAAELDMLLNGDVLQNVPRLFNVAACLLLPTIVALLLCTLLPSTSRFAGGAGVAGAFLVLGGYWLLASVVFSRGWILSLSYVSWAVISAAFYSAIYALYFATRSRKELKKVLGTYTSPKVVDRLLDRYEQGEDLEAKMAGERAEISLFFSDIAGFTSISEALDANELVSLLNEYLARMTHILVERYDAVLDKYIGDAIMAFWGAPDPQPDQAERAVLAALDNLAAMDELAAEVSARGLPVMTARVGLNTGEAVCGTTGSDLKVNYTALGDTVNLAARLESINKYYGTRILMGPRTFEQTGHIVVSREVDWVKVKGKDIPASMYEVMCRRASERAAGAQALADRYQEAFEAYKSGQFQVAEGLFQKLLVDYPADGPSELMLRRCQNFLANGAPEDWTGAWEMTDK